jgi:DNA helicase-2/ATP-dependent DNA helicase PcrA
MDPDRLLDGLDPSQREAVTTEASPLAILAGAGSGKTRVLTRRIAHRCLTGSADPRHVLAITFTRRAAGELDTRLRAFGLRDLPAAGTFHAVAYAQLRTRWAATGTAVPTLLDRKARVLRRILGSTTRIDAADLAAEIEWARARLVEPDAYPQAAARADRRPPVDPERIAEWYRRYEQEKRRRGLVDFDDLLARCADAIETDPTFAAAQRWRFRHLFVDEFQDVNPLQERLLRAWLGGSPDLCVVGDPNQAIYGWNGADASFLLRFAERYPGGRVVRLGRTYRSTPQVLATAAAVLAGVPDAVPVPEPVRSDGPVPRTTGYATDVAEAQGIARAVHDHHGPGRPWSAQAVLVRTNAQAALIEAAFRRAAIPYRLRGAHHVLDDPEVRDLLRRLERLREPLATTVADLEQAVAAQREALGATEGEAAVGGEAADHHALGRRLAAYELIVRLGHDLLVVEPTARTEGFGEWLRATVGTEGERDVDAVTIATFHAAKGLEWPVVHLAGLEAGYVPITHARTPAARAEEQRLLYVAVTRAADVLSGTWAQRRTFGAQEVDRRPSPHLAAMRAAAAELAAASRAPASPTAAVAESRASLAAAPGARPDDERAAAAVRAALRGWRAEQARAAGVRPTVVLADRALEALARRRPADPAELAEVAELGPVARDRHGPHLLALIARSDPSRPVQAGPRT